MARETQAQRIERRLRTETAYWARGCVQIINEDGQGVPFVFRTAQDKIEAALKAQDDAGLPMRAVVLKARRIGSSRYGMAKLVHRCTLKENRRALIVAHTSDTAGELFDDAERFYSSLPSPPDAPPWLKPGLRNARNSQGAKMIHWGNAAKNARMSGDRGVDSSLHIDTASEVEAGRGKTITDLWCSEVGFWPDPKKALSLVNAVFDRPDTMIVLESTANGHNFFKTRWDRAVAGESAFVPVFISWLDDPNCFLHFRSDDERLEFEAGVGTGEFGEDEPHLQEKGATLEQLAWRRRAIVDRADGKLDQFRQEYPSFPEEAFIASGKHVFSQLFVSQALGEAEITDKQGVQGILKETGTKTRQLLSGTLDVPTGALFVPRSATGFSAAHNFWKVWTLPCGCRAHEGCTGSHEGEDKPQFIATADVADGEENTMGEGAFHAIEVIDHKTGEQAAEWVSKCDPDLLTRELVLAGLFWNRAWIAPEVTGSHGLPVARDAWHKYGYPMVYKRKAVETTRVKQSDRLGWDTNRKTKPLIIAQLQALLREGTHGMRSRPLVLEFTTYVQMSNGRQGPDDEAHSDRLMAYGIAQQLRTEIRLRPTAAAGVAQPSAWRGPQRPT